MKLMQVPGDNGSNDDLGLVRHVTCGLDSTYVTMRNGVVRVMGASKYGQVRMRRNLRLLYVK